MYLSSIYIIKSPFFIIAGNLLTYFITPLGYAVLLRKYPDFKGKSSQVVLAV